MKGWYGEPVRHGLASRGIKTSTKEDKSINKIGDFLDDLNLKNLYHLAALGIRTDERLKLSDSKTQEILDLNERAEHEYEWIADLDIDEDGNIYINDEVISEEHDSADMNWQEHVTADDYADPEVCVGYIHYHPKTVDEKETAQDYILALTIDDLRDESNKDRFRPTVFGLVRDDWVKFYYLTPCVDSKVNYKKKLEKIRDTHTNGKISLKEYFEKLDSVKEEMKDKNILSITKKINLED